MTDLQSRPLAGPRRVGACRYALSSTRLPANRTRNSAPHHSKSSRDVLSTCVRAPVSGSVFMDIDVRVLLWSGSDLANVIAASLPAGAQPSNVHELGVRT